MLNPDVAKYLAEIDAALETVRKQTAIVRNRRGKIRRLLADAFNSDPKNDGFCVLEARDIIIGADPCEASPTGMCAYAHPTCATRLPYTDQCVFCEKRVADGTWTMPTSRHRSEMVQAGCDSEGGHIMRRQPR